VAFLQGGASLSTTVTGLMAGATYTVRFRTNRGADSNNLPVASWSLNGGPFMGLEARVPVAASNPYRTVMATFTASGDTAALQVRNTSLQADSALLLDGFTVAAAENPEWRMTPWIDDGDIVWD
jgi:hypothetical protein